jgi:hypothetical protein
MIFSVILFKSVHTIGNEGKTGVSYMVKGDDLYLIRLEANEISWWEYARNVSPVSRPSQYLTYWSFLKNRGKLPKRLVKEAEWRMEARRKGLLDT